MARHKVFHVAAMLVVLGSVATVARAGNAGTGELPASQKANLSCFARAVLCDSVSRKPARATVEIDELKAAPGGQLVLRVRSHGYLLGVGVGSGESLVIAAQAAAESAASWILEGQATDAASCSDWLIEMELVGALVALPSKLDWTRPGVLRRHMEPGVDGLALTIGDKLRHLCPSELATTDLSFDETMVELAHAMQLSAGQVTQVSLMRFRSVHWYEPSASQPIVSLRRGMTLIAADAVSPANLRDSITRLAEHMTYRQRSDGSFAYEFSAATDRYSDEDNVIRQMGAVAGLARYAKGSGDAKALAAAEKGIRRQLQGLTPLPGQDDAAFIATEDGNHRLGATALLCVALLHFDSTEAFADERRRLIRGILSLQRPSGMFITAFPPAEGLDGQDYFPGEALLALAMEYENQPSAAILESFDRAIGFYQDYFRARRSASLIPWQVQAFAIMAERTKRKDYADYVFELTDWLLSRQLDSTRCEWPELHGGVALGADNDVSAATAAYLEGISDALALARRRKDTVRVQRYERAVRLAARFVMQLQFRSEEGYFVRSPQDVIGGVRAAPTVNRIRIDHCQHALVGLIKAHEVLYPSGS